ncbi:MAG: hypothetical protein IPM85_16385 [Chitinophagaceae bacterium]|nr:hypothetical protein [Chitinophagaceae bacterium]
MKLHVLAISLAALLFTACSGKETAKSIAQKWCDLNAKAYKADDGAAKDAAKYALKQYEDKIEAKYKDNETFMKEVEAEVEKCEDASEGR